MLLAGCAPAPKPVTVDESAILAAERLGRAAPVTLPKPPGPVASTQTVVPGRPARALRDPSNTGGLDIRGLILQEQERAYQALLRRLRGYYDQEAERFEKEQLRALDQESRKAYGVAGELIRAAFEDYASDRAPQVARLALLAGWPDPDPKSTTSTEDLRPLAKQRLEEMEAIRKSLTALEAQFDRQVSAILAAVEDQTGVEAAAIRLKIELQRADMDRRANTEAQSQVRRQVSDLGLRLIAPAPVAVAGSPPHRKVVAGMPSPKPGPEIVSTGVLSTLDDRRRILQQELSIWAGIHRYAIVSEGAPDATQEFIRWRESFRPGP